MLNSISWNKILVNEDGTFQIDEDGFWARQALTSEEVDQLIAQNISAQVTILYKDHNKYVIDPLTDKHKFYSPDEIERKLESLCQNIESNSRNPEQADKEYAKYNVIIDFGAKPKFIQPKRFARFVR